MPSASKPFSAGSALFYVRNEYGQRTEPILGTILTATQGNDTFRVTFVPEDHRKIQEYRDLPPGTWEFVIADVNGDVLWTDKQYVIDRHQSTLTITF